MKSSRTIFLYGTLCLLGFIAAQANPNESNDEVICPSGWYRIHRGCYMFIVEELNWDDALEHCKDHSGELTSLHSWNEKEAVYKYIVSNYEDIQRWWVGLQKNRTANQWMWLDNHPLDTNVLAWLNPGQMSTTKEACGVVDKSKARLHAAPNRCTSERPFICEYHNITPRPNTDITSPRSDEIFGIATTEAIQQLDANTTSISHDSTNDATAIWSTSDLNLHSLGTSPKEVKTTDQTPTTKKPLPPSVSSSQTETLTSISSSNSETTLIMTTLKPTTEKHSLSTATSITNGDVDSTTERSQEITTTVLSTTQSSTIVAHTTRPTTPYPTQPTKTSLQTPVPTMVDWVKALADFEGCYIPGTGGSIRDTVMSARRFYTESRTTCPEVQIGSILWSAVEIGETAKANCIKGDGFATFKCGSERRCWTGQPDISGCASKKLQFLLKTVEVSDNQMTVAPPTIKESIELSSQLAEATSSEDTTMEDVMVTSQVITALTQVTEGAAVKDKEQVQAIVDNVVKAGSNLVSSNKSSMWEEMSQDDKVRSASTLLVAMETATVSMAQEINEPSVITQRNENIELELRVVDMSALEKDDKKELTYDSSQSDSSFSIPMETLKSVSRGGLAKAVFMTHYSMSDILGRRSKKHTSRPVATPQNIQPSSPEVSEEKNEVNAAMEVAEEESETDEAEVETGPRIASYILSASLGSEGPITKLPKPITFTMRHVEEIDARYIPLCSFWNVSQSAYQGFWSQQGCRVLRTNKSHTTCECDHLTNFAILLDVHGFQASKIHQSLLRLVTIIGCVISCVSLMASWVTFQCFTSLQGERNSIHKNLALTLLLAEILFVVGIDQARHQILCSVIAGFLHFFFLAAFTWMFIEGLHIIFMLVQVFDASRSRLPYYYLTGYGVPSVIVGASCLFFYKGYGTDKFCWLTTDRYFIWAFAGPVAIILLVNALFLTYAMSTVCRHSEYVFSSKDKATGSGIRTWVQGALALEVLLGLTWTLGYFLINDDSLPLAYIFSVMNSLQGLFIFVFHCLLNKKAQKEYRLMARSVVRRSPSSATTHSTLTKRTNNTNHSHDQNHSLSNSHQKLNVSNGHSMA